MARHSGLWNRPTMREDRKRKLRRREEKHARRDERRRASFERLLDFLGVKEVFDRFPPHLYEIFLRQLDPSLEIIAAEDSVDDPEVQRVVRKLRTVVKRPVKSFTLGRAFDLSLEDYIRGYYTIIQGVEFFSRRFRESPGWKSLRSSQVRRLMEEARAIIGRIDRDWVSRVFVRLAGQINTVTDVHLQIDRRIIAATLVEGRKPEGTPCQWFEVRLHQARPRILKGEGAEWKAFPCVWTSALDGPVQVKWNCPALGIEGPEIDLPVFVSEHAIARLSERLPFPPRFRSLLHILMVNALDGPVVLPADQGKYLVEVRYGTGRAGYFVAKVFPGFVLILTFLFLTMEGTPEAKLLREKLGLHRKHIEEYRLDRFFTLTGSDLARDPLLSAVLAECGCGHLITLIEDESEGKWLDTFGERLKQGFGLREAQGGFKVGQKWVGWSEDNPFLDEDEQDEDEQD